MKKFLLIIGFLLLGGIAFGASSLLVPKNALMVYAKAGLSQKQLDALPTLYVFSSTACPHCAELHIDFYPKMMKKYVNTGKLRVVQFPFPLETASLTAQQLEYCVDKGKARENMMTTYYKTQRDWIKGSDIKPIIKNIIRSAKFQGLSSKKIKTCLDDKKLQNKILKMRQEAIDTFHINGTPTLYFVNKSYQPVGKPIVGFAPSMSSEVMAFLDKGIRQYG